MTEQEYKNIISTMRSSIEEKDKEIMRLKTENLRLRAVLSSKTESGKKYANGEKAQIVRSMFQEAACRARLDPEKISIRSGCFPTYIIYYDGDTMGEYNLNSNRVKYKKSYSNKSPGYVFEVVTPDNLPAILQHMKKERHDRRVEFEKKI